MNGELEHNFEKDLYFSMGNREKVDCEMIKSAIPSCISVKKTDSHLDKKGIDYIATLKNGAIINIDAKARRKGVKKVNGYPVLAIETWSVISDDKKKVGWTYSTKTNVDIILYTFDKTDYSKFFLVPFQHLRMASIKNYYRWKDAYGELTQNNKYWVSKCIFVPADVVLNAVFDEMVHEI